MKKSCKKFIAVFAFVIISRVEQALEVAAAILVSQFRLVHLFFVVTLIVQIPLLLLCVSLGTCRYHYFLVSRDLFRATYKIYTATKTRIAFLMMFIFVVVHLEHRKQQSNLIPAAILKKQMRSKKYCNFWYWWLNNDAELGRKLQ